MVLVRVLIVLTLAASVATGCGRRGALAPPPGAENSIAAKRDPGAGPAKSDTFGNLDALTEEGRVGTETQTSAEEEERTSDPSGRRFILDPLI